MGGREEKRELRTVNSEQGSGNQVIRDTGLEVAGWWNGQVGFGRNLFGDVKKGICAKSSLRSSKKNE